MKSKKSKATFFSIMPGAGHMYLGLQRQGLELMGLFFIFIFLNDWLHTDLFAFCLPLIWFFSIFDARHKASFDELPADKDIAIFSCISSRESWIKDKGRIIGYALIVIGLIGVLDRIVFPFIDFSLTWQVRQYIQTGIVSGVLIFIGIKLLMSSRTSQQS